MHHMIPPWKHVGSLFYMFSSELNNISELGYWLAEIPWPAQHQSSIDQDFFLLSQSATISSGPRPGPISFSISSLSLLNRGNEQRPNFNCNSSLYATCGNKDSSLSLPLSFPYPLEYSHSQFVVKILYYLKLELRLLSSYLCWSRRKDAEFNDSKKGWGGVVIRAMCAHTTGTHANNSS